MSNVRTPTDLTLDALKSSEFFRDADRDVMAAFQRVLVARVSSHPMGIPERMVDWTELEQELSRLCDYIRIRHAAKHCALIEAVHDVKPVIVVIEEGEDAKLLDGVPSGLLDLRDRVRNGG